MEVWSHGQNPSQHGTKREQRFVFSKVASGKMLLVGLLCAAALAKSVEWREKLKFFLLENSPLPKASERAFLVNRTDLPPLLLLLCEKQWSLH